MIFFGITLRAKAASKNWETVCACFNRTLRSVFRQTVPDFKVFVACHDIPHLEQEYDDRLHFLTTNVKVPETPDEMMKDKGYKLTMIALAIRELGGGYTMIVDADDLVSNRIAEYCRDHPNENGFISKYGYIWNQGQSWCKKMFLPYKTCGSCIIANYVPEDLPYSLPESPEDDSQKDIFIIRQQHYTIPGEFKKAGRPLKKIDLITTLYVRNTGENHSMIVHDQLRFKRRVELLFRKKIEIKSIWPEYFASWSDVLGGTV